MPRASAASLRCPDGIARSLEYADVLGTPMLQSPAGVPPNGMSRERCREVLIDNLRFAAAELAKHGRMLLIEPKNTRDMPGYFLNTQADAHAIREEVGAPNLKVQMDFYHVQIVEGDIAVKLKKYLPHVGHIQIAGVPDRSEPDDGEVNYRYLLHLLDELGYGGWVGCEYNPRGRTEDGLSWMKTLVKETTS